MNENSSRPCGCDPGANHVCEWHSGLKQQMEEKARRFKVRDLDKLRHRVHEANKRWWEDLETGQPIERNVGEMLMLVVSEFAEAMEGDRKRLMDDKIPTRPMREVELADALIRLLDIAGAPEYDVSLGGGYRYLFRWSENFADNLYQLVKALSYQSRAELKATIGITIHGILELSSRMNLDIDGAFEDKMQYNATRHDHTREGRLAKGGKRY